MDALIQRREKSAQREDRELTSAIEVALAAVPGTEEVTV
jgi:hypothetical protein